jgi:hypothetical protein
VISVVARPCASAAMGQAPPAGSTPDTTKERRGLARRSEEGATRLTRSLEGARFKDDPTMSPGSRRGFF